MMKLFKDNRYLNYLLSDEWKQKKKERLGFDNYTCQICGKRSETELEVHHRNYDNLYNEKVEDLITLCFKCHNIEQERYKVKKEVNKSFGSFKEESSFWW